MDVVKNLKEKVDYIYEWTNKGDLKKRKQVSEDEENSEKNNSDEDSCKRKLIKRKILNLIIIMANLIA